jgi:ubiquinone/menaquinone biosynthesis C-methylase UbiE
VTSDRARMEDVYRSRERLASRYSLDNPGNRFNFEQLRRSIDVLLNTVQPDKAEIKALDIGCGGLFWAEELVGFGLERKNCFGVDILHWRMREGHGHGRDIQAINASAAALPFRSGSFDLVCQFTLMTSVLDSRTRNVVVDEIRRILRPGGYILWYDFRYNNPANPHTRAIGRAELRRLFRGWNISVQSITLVPQLARKTPGFLIPVLKFLHRLPMLRTHYVALIGPKG